MIIIIIIIIMQCNRKLITTIEIIQKFSTYFQKHTPISAKNLQETVFEEAQQSLSL